MRPSEALKCYRDQISEIVAASGVKDPVVFGSAVRGDDRESSDLDIMITPVSGQTTLFTLGRLAGELQDLTGCLVDLCSSRSVPDSFKKKVKREGCLL